MAASHPIAGAKSKFISVTTRNMVWLFIIAFIALAGTSAPAQAAKYAAIVIEEDNGRVLFARNADSLRYPASLTKIMNDYIKYALLFVVLLIRKGFFKKMLKTTAETDI